MKANEALLQLPSNFLSCFSVAIYLVDLIPFLPPEWDVCLFSLCDSIYSVTYPLFENREFPYFHPLLCCHHNHVFSLFSSPTAPSDRSSRLPEVSPGVFLVVLVKSVTILEALLVLEDVHSIPKLCGPSQNQPARC